MRQRSPNSVNPKRMRPEPSEAELVELQALAAKSRYGGNPEHKKNPGDFGLSPASQPRQGKTLCDAAEIFTRAEALKLLREGFRRGMVSEQERNGWPQNVWAVAENGTPLEAMLENRDSGTYHAYPMFSHDPLRSEVLKRWNRKAHG